MSSREDQSNTFLSSDCIDDNFFITIVEQKLKISRDKFKLRLVFISSAAGKNENFVSVVYRAKINIELIENNQRQFVDVIIKAMLSTLPEIKEWSVFPREQFMYEGIIGNFEEIWKERANETICFGPSCIKILTEPYEIIVLDDLKAEGYAMMNRKIGCDEIQTKLVLDKLTRFHAASAVRYQKDGIVKSYLDRKLSMPQFTNDSPFYAGYTKSHGGFVKVLREIEGFTKIADLISKWKPGVRLNTFFVGSEPMRCGFKVLNHGDNWLNNMMFKVKENGKSVDVKLLDYQISYWGSPAGDLFYFLISSVREEIKVEKFDDFIQFYHERLVDSLKKLNYDQHIPTLSDLQIDLIEKRAMGASCVMDIMFVCKYDSEEELTMEQFMDPNAYNEDMLNRMYKSELFLDAVKSWMPFLYKRGFLDTVDGENDDDPKSLNDIVGKSAANDKLKENGEVVEE